MSSCDISDVADSPTGYIPPISTGMPPGYHWPERDPELKRLESDLTMLRRILDALRRL